MTVRNNANNRTIKNLAHPTLRVSGCRPATMCFPMKLLFLQKERLVCLAISVAGVALNGDRLPIRRHCPAVRYLERITVMYALGFDDQDQSIPAENSAKLAALVLADAFFAVGGAIQHVGTRAVAGFLRELCLKSRIPMRDGERFAYRPRPQTDLPPLNIHFP